MDPLHRQVILDCYDDVVRDMDPALVLRYSTVNWGDGDPGFIRAKTKNEGRFTGAKALLDILLDLPYDGFDDFVQNLRDVPYDHLVKQLLETRARLHTAVEKGRIKKKNLGWRPHEIRRWRLNRIGALSILLTSLIICIWIFTGQYGTKRRETPLLDVFPRRLKTFVGREDALNRIDACLEQNQTCLIKGLGGVGKTSLAIEYGHRRAGRYPGGVFWVRNHAYPSDF
ncbi:Hypp4597 [Branchiostoma lanceolatum]|uniref:Hypp4597 protein n=1 Tax=Branchiostoma lanceolatum TaxID=7740 RepID=A0A8K0AEE5_BRALA|nr:Hypp4597 [Branchiostoma lanceolatum]